MTQNEFAAWLDGFLDGKLAPEDVERVRQKALTVMPEWPTMPVYPPVFRDPPRPDESGFNPWIYQPIVTSGSIGSKPTHGQTTWWAGIT